MLSPTTCPPTVSQPALTSGFEVWSAILTGATDYWTQAMTRQATPLDVARDGMQWWTEMLRRREPTWSSPNEIVFETPVLRLRDFSDGTRDRVVPTLVLPPQAGHSSCIVDYSERQSQMEAVRAAGLTRAYALDWVGATQATKHSTVDDYLAGIERAVEEMGAPVNLVGDCQGGWLATIYAALHPEQIHTLTIAGAPIDFHAGDAMIHGYVQLFDQSLDMAFYRAVVAMGNGLMKGEFMLNGFITMKPQDEVAKQIGLLSHLDDPEHLERYRPFEDWFKHTQDISGDFYLWIVEHLFRDNTLIKGELEIGGARADMRRISCPVNLLAGATDHITPPAQVFRAADFVSTPAEQITERTTSGGHLGLFMGREALRDYWPPILADVAVRSKQGARRAPAQRRAKAATPRGRGPEIPIP